VLHRSALPAILGFRATQLRSRYGVCEIGVDTKRSEHFTGLSHFGCAAHAMCGNTLAHVSGQSVKINGGKCRL
jgi:hypothetical protein